MCAIVVRLCVTGEELNTQQNAQSRAFLRPTISSCVLVKAISDPKCTAVTAPRCTNKSLGNTNTAKWLSRPQPQRDRSKNKGPDLYLVCCLSHFTICGCLKAPAKPEPRPAGSEGLAVMTRLSAQCSACWEDETAR